MSRYYLEIYENPNSFSESDLAYEMAQLPLERREKASRFINMIDKKLSVLAYKLLREGLEKYYGISRSEKLEIGYYNNNKPRLIEYPDIHFNISHCHQAVACIFSNREVGVDVEGLISYDDDLLRRIANHQEYNDIVTSDNPSLACTILWTKKESYLKMDGTGLVDDLHSLLAKDFDNNYHFEHNYSSNYNYVLGVCYAKQHTDIK